MTLSIAGHCARTGMLGAAISSSSICVASRCVWARAGVGVVLTQNVTNPALGPLGLELLASGLTPSQALEKLREYEAFPAYRQLTLLDAQGHTAHHSGAHCLGRHAFFAGQGCLAAGNLLANEAVPQAMVEGFVAAEDQHLAARLLAALAAGLRVGGEAGPLRSAGLLVVQTETWPLVDLRVDWDEAPLTCLRELWRLYEPQIADYLARAQNPGAAPSFGVPGDE
jgi:uncharacterized Ntn-hydrolase superfamily protein